MYTAVDGVQIAHLAPRDRVDPSWSITLRSVVNVAFIVYYYYGSFLNKEYSKLLPKPNKNDSINYFPPKRSTHKQETKTKHTNIARKQANKGETKQELYISRLSDLTDESHAEKN